MATMANANFHVHVYDKLGQLIKSYTLEGMKKATAQYRLSMQLAVRIGGDVHITDDEGNVVK
jgi:hypothetical protein